MTIEIDSVDVRELHNIDIWCQEQIQMGKFSSAAVYKSIAKTLRLYRLTVIHQHP